MKENEEVKIMHELVCLDKDDNRVELYCEKHHDIDYLKGSILRDLYGDLKDCFVDSKKDIVKVFIHTYKIYTKRELVDTITLARDEIK